MRTYYSTVNLVNCLYKNSVRLRTRNPRTPQNPNLAAVRGLVSVRRVSRQLPVMLGALAVSTTPVVGLQGELGDREVCGQFCLCLYPEMRPEERLRG